MISLNEARDLVGGQTATLDAVSVPCYDALGLVLATDVTAHEAVPPFANTAMDGYAVRASDTAGASPDAPISLQVVGVLAAGAPPSTTVELGTAIRIMTGAPMPEGADAIVMVERTERDDANGSVRIAVPATVGDHVRRAGGDVQPGQVVFTKGTVLGAAHLGVLASLDAAIISVVPRARVAVLSTGDELVERGALTIGKIRDSNRPMLLGMVREAGCIPIDFGIAADDEAIIYAAIERAVDSCDALITSGAVSVGDFDFVKVAIERLALERGGSYRWSQVAIKPAKPLAFAQIAGRNGALVPIFGLPGNPVSSHVSFEVFARHMTTGRAALVPWPIMRRKTGRAKTSKLTCDDTGLPGSPKIGTKAPLGPAICANANGFAGLIATCDHW